MTDEQNDDFNRSIVEAEKFLDGILLPQLYEFDLDNVDEKYVKGSAVYKLFLEMAFALQQLGWGKEELKQEIEIYIQDTGDHTIH